MDNTHNIPAEWYAEFEAARKRSLEERFRYGFVRTYRPVLDDASYRSFDTMEEYRQWCEENLPDWLGQQHRRLSLQKCPPSRIATRSGISPEGSGPPARDGIHP